MSVTANIQHQHATKKVAIKSDYCIQNKELGAKYKKKQ